MTYYKFVQNNSFGVYEINDEAGIGRIVWVEAASENDALERAEKIGLYFNGVEEGKDCPCCGDRWYAPWEEEDKPKIDQEFDFNWHKTIYIHHLNGTIERIGMPK